MSISVFLDYLSKLSSFGLFIVACIGLNQLKIAKKDIRVKSERESITLTGEICTKYGNEIIILFQEIYKTISKSKYKEKINEIMKKLGNELKENEICEGFFKKSDHWFELISIYMDIDLIDDFNLLANQLEGISIYFIKGVANEEIAFAPMGESFCNICNYIIPIIALSRCTACGKCDDSYKKHSYENLIELYQIWLSKIRNEQLSSQMKKINHELNKYKSNNKVDVIGTN